MTDTRDMTIREFMDQNKESVEGNLVYVNKDEEVPFTAGAINIADDTVAVAMIPLNKEKLGLVQAMQRIICRQASKYIPTHAIIFQGFLLASADLARALTKDLAEEEKIREEERGD